MPDMKTEREWQRLLALYAEKSDEELLELHERKDDLTELAQGALAETMQGRGLVAEAEPGLESSEAESELGEADVDGRMLVYPDEVYLYDFEDSIRASVAARFLDRAEIEHRLVVRPQGSGEGRKRRYSASVALVVPREYEKPALEILQKEMRLFSDDEANPVLNTYGEGGVDPGTVVEGIDLLGEFNAAQAAVVTAALAARGIPFEVELHPRGDGALLISVAAERVEEAFELMGEIAETLPE